MGFYIRKSVKAGPFRFNLSKSGIGTSVGVRGFRVGTGLVGTARARNAEGRGERHPRSQRSNAGDLPAAGEAARE